MSKVLKIVGEVVAVGALAIATAGVGLAVAAGASLGAAVAGAGAIFAGTIGLSLGTALAIGAGLTLAGGLLAKKPQVSPSQIDRTNVSLVVDAPRKIVFGHTALATDLRYQEFFGNNQENCAQVLLLASHWCESVEQVWLNDVLAWTATGGTQGVYSAYFYVKYFAQAITGDAFVSGWSHRWGSNAAFIGCATLYLEFKTSPNSSKATSPFSGSIPTRITIRGKAARVYDPRLDSSVGGAGAMRAADQTTWAWSASGLEIGRNPALCMLFYLIGWRIQNPATGVWKLAVGIGVPIDRIDLSSFMTAANMCDEPVTLSAGGTEPRYRCDGMFSEADDPSTVITAIEGCMNAKLRDSAGRFSLQVFHNDLATPVIDLTEDDVLDDFTWDAGGALNDLKNVVKGRYTDPSDASLYQLVDYPTRSVAALDGIDRIDSVDQALVQSPGQAQRLANQRLERYQYPGTFTGNFKARAWVLKDGDIVRLTFPALGFAQKLFRVAKATIQVSGVVPLVLAEENAAIYAWDSSDAAAIVVAAPIAFDILMQPIKLAIDDAAESAVWSAVTDDNGLRPQDGSTRNVPRGAWNGITNYSQGDIVTYNGSSYLAGENIVAGIPPTNTAYWDLLASGGTAGAPGSAGATGATGPTGVQGAPGANGQPAYVHVAYADSSDGSVDFVVGLANPGRTFIGIYTDAASASSSDYRSYYWSRLTGQDGLNGTNGTPGPIGANGQPTYVHFAYADSADGSVNFTADAPGNRTYIGVYSDYTAPDSTDYHAYAWSLIKGADGSAGATGSPGSTGSPGATGGPGAPGAAGSNGVDGLSALNIHTVGAVTWDGHNLFCTSSANSWTVNGAYSSNVIPGGVALTFQRPNAFGNEDGFFGICQLPSASIDYPKIDGSWRMHQDGNTYTAEAWHGNSIVFSEGWNGGYTYSVRYDTNTGIITWYRFNSSGGGGAVATYSAGAGLSFGVMATAARNMSVYNVAFTAAGGTGAVGSAGSPGANGAAGGPGPIGPQGPAGISPSPSYPAINLPSEGTFAYGNPIPLNNGITLTGSAFINASVQSNPANISVQIQYSLDGGGSWNTLASDTETATPGEPVSVAPYGQYTNSSGSRQVVNLRTIISRSGQAPSYNSGTMQPS